MLRSAVSRTTLKAVGQGGLGGSSSHADAMHPNLGLHSAAATGNIGLVKFALENGQPANSNLNGILPLHAACSGGSEQSVRMLIFHGADVNAPRLKAKGSTGGPGAEGSTPLHFAAANGHLDIVRILLEAGARPAAADKDGVFPEALALSAGHSECANLIRSWISAYGSNGLAGMVEARETVSGQVTLGPAAYIRYAASGGSNSPLSPSSTAKSTQQTLTTSTTNVSTSTPPSSSQLTPQSSFDTTSASAGASKVAVAKGAWLTKTSSNPNLRNQASSAANAPLSIASPASLSASQSQSHSASAVPATSATSPGLGAFPPAFPQHDSSTQAASFSATRSPSLASAVPAGVAATLGSGSARESKRRPSLPSIFEKAAHPAASLRAALATGSSGHTGAGASLSQASSSKYLDHSYDATTTSPGKKHGRLAGKRSLSHILRKATGSSTSSTSQQATLPSSSRSFFTDASAAGTNNLLSGGTINMDALAKPGRTPGSSFDHQRSSPANTSHRATRRNTGSEASTDDTDAWKHSTTNAPPLPTSRSDATALGQQRTLRNASSSSSLSAAREPFSADGQARRNRAGSNDQVSTGARFPLRANASLDLLRPTGPFGQNDDGATAPGRQSAERYRSASNQNSRIDAMRRLAAGSESNSPHLGASSGALHPASRDRSVSGSSSQSAATTDNERSHTHSTVDETADEEDLQEFLDHTLSEAAGRNMDDGERHDSHKLPAGLRTMTALRQQNNARDAGDSQATEAAPSRPSSNPLGAANDDSPRISGSALANRMTRDRSGSHVSAVSSSSQSGHSSRGIDLGPRNSPGLAPNFQALSIAEENGVPSHSAHAASTIVNRAGRAPSVAESVTSHASSSSLRSNYLSAAEQAQAILNHETPYTSDGPDGTSTSLAAQLAAYGEALALERRRAGDVRSGPSPSLSARGSNAALRTKLPSVSEDQSPSRTATHSSRSFSVSEQRAPNYPATAAQSYNRRVSRRPHSSEGRQSQEGGKRGTFGAAAPTIGPSTLSAIDKARLGQNKSPASFSSVQGQSGGQEKQSCPLPCDRERTATPNLAGGTDLGSPLNVGRPPAEASIGSTALPRQASKSSALASDRGEEVGPTVPPKDQPTRRRHEPVVFSSTAGLPFDISQQRQSASATAAAELGDDDEDDPKTPVLGGNKSVLDKFETPPDRLHRHSPSLPTELSSYTSDLHTRLSHSALTDSFDSSSTAGSTPPVPPPRKDSIPSAGHDDSTISSENRMLSPDSAVWSSWRSGEGTTGREGEVSQDKAVGGGSTTSSRWEGLRRPSLNMLRSATSSSTHSQTPSQTSSTGAEGYSRWSTEEAGKADLGTVSQQQTGKRRLVRNLLNKAKGS